MDVTRTIVNAVLRDELNDGEFRQDSTFGLSVPAKIEGVDAKYLDPSKAWADAMRYSQAARELQKLFASDTRTSEA